MRKTIKILLASISLIICSQKPLMAQKKDSLSIILNQSVHDTVKIQSLNRIGKKHFFKREFDSCEIYAKSALVISESANNKHYIAVSNKILGQIYLSKNDYSTALKHYLKAIETYRELEDTTCISYIYGLNDIGFIYSTYGMYPKSYEYYLKALKVAEKLNDKSLIISTNLDIAELYSKKNEYDKSMPIYLNTLKLIKKNDDTINYYPILFNGLANNYLGKKDYSKSLLYYKRVINIGNYIDDSVTTSAGQIGIATNYMKMSKYDSAIKYLNNSLLLKTNNSKNNAVSYGMLGDIYFIQNKYELSKQNLYKSLEISKEFRLNSILCDNYRSLYLIDSCTKNYKSYIENFTLFVAYRDSLNNIDSERKIVSAEMNYYFDKEKETQKLRQEEINKVNELEKKRQRDIISGIVIALIILVLFSIFVYRSYLSKNKANKVITQQKHLVEEKQKEILDNINYAKRIQTSRLPSESFINKNVKDNFIMFKPKDVVSGDFYWATEKDNKFFLATADCTGHGVSGSMMSMLCISILNEVVNQRGVSNTGEVLDETRKEIVKSLNPNETEGISDGMDCTLFAFNFKNKTLEYSSANNNFYVLKNGELINFKADKMPVGLGIKMDSFTTTTIQLESGDIVYSTSDGFKDQFGYNSGKKFKAKQLESLLVSIGNLTMNEQKNALNKAFNDWKGNAEQTDDVLVIGIRIS